MRIPVIVVAAAVCGAAFLPVRTQATLPLADVKLVAEKSVPYSEFATAQKNGQSGRNGKNRYVGGRRGYYANGTNALSRSGDGELVAVELR